MGSKLKEGTTNAENIALLSVLCEVNETLRNISPRWKIGLRQFSLLKEAFPSLSDQVLGKRLAELVAAGLANKTELGNRIPQQILYAPTEKGEELLKIMDDLHQWEIRWK
jgi:DNA-binding HxlR family transcriptional regulator